MAKARTAQYSSSSRAVKQVQNIARGRITTWDKYHSISLTQKSTNNSLTNDEANWLRDYRERKQIAEEVVNIIENDNHEAKPSQNPVKPKSTKDAEKNANYQGRVWKTSLQAVSIGARAGYAYGNLYFRNKASTDNLAQQQTRFRTAESTIAVGLSLFSHALASSFSFATQVFSTHISNKIQRRGDRKRVIYNLANYDLGKYGTYAYDNTSNEWINQDANKVKAKVLGRKTSS